VAIYFAVQVGLGMTEALLGMTRVQGGRVGKVFEANPMIEKSINSIQNVLFPALPAGFDATWLGRVAFTAAVALAVACLLFERREVPYGAE
jgi:hypothetical protein